MQTSPRPSAPFGLKQGVVALLMMDDTRTPSIGKICPCAVATTACASFAPSDVESHRSMPSSEPTMVVTRTSSERISGFPCGFCRTW
jgi:hypothetical protein